MNLGADLIEAVRTLASRYPVAKIVLFGSRAREDNRWNSDIDLAVYPLPGFIERGMFSSAVDELPTLLKIDVVFVEGGIDPALRERIRQEGVTIYERI